MRMRFIDKRTQEILVDWSFDDFYWKQDKQKPYLIEGMVNIEDNKWEQDRKVKVQVDLSQKKDWWNEE